MAKCVYIGVSPIANMLGENGDMEPGITTSGSVSIVSSEHKFGSGSLLFKSLFSQAIDHEVQYAFYEDCAHKFEQNHKYYFSFWVMQGTSVDLSLRVYIRPWSTAVTSNILENVKNTQLNVWEQHSVVFTSQTSSDGITIGMACDGYSGSNKLIYMDGLMLVDLTAIYGSGNEPDKDWCDANIQFTTSSDNGDSVARKVTKCYIGVDGVARKIKKAYLGVDGVARLVYTSGDVWKKYNASRSWNSGWYSQTDYEVGNTHTSGGYYGNPVSLNLYDGYTFSQSSGFSGTTTSSSGKYKIDSTHVYMVAEMAVNDEKTTDTNIYVDITWECVASALYYSGWYTYSMGAYIEDVTAEEGQLPTTAKPAHTESNGNRIYVQENGTLYCYEKVV